MTQPDNDAYSKGFDIDLTKRILRYVKPYRGLATGGVLLALLTAGLQPVPAFLQGYAIDHALTPFVDGSDTDAAKLLNLLLLIVLGYILVQIIEFGLTYASALTIGYLGQNVLRDIRADVFTKLQRLHLAYFDQNPVGRLITRVTSDVDAINQFITGGLISMITSTFLILVYMGVMLSINWRLALIAFTVLPFLFVATNYFRGKMRLTYRDTRIQQAIVNTKLNENITGMQTVQLFGRERRSALDFEHSNRALLSALERSVYWFSMFMPVVAILGQVSIALVLYFGAKYILGVDVGTGAQAALSVGVLYAFVQWTTQLFQPIQDLADVFNNLQAAMASSERIFGVLDTEEEITDRPDAKKLGNFIGQVDFENVWFSYDSSVKADTPDTDDRWILRGVDLHIAPGESVALVGATGAGKTSVTALVSRFYDVQRAAVKVDGEDVQDLDQHDLRKHIGLVLQDVFLFAGTIESNLTLNDPSIPH